MRGKLIAFVSIFCCFIFIGFPVFPYQLPDTGQHKCYDNEKEISCPSPGQPFYGQDAQYQGYEPSYSDNGNGTVTDLNTAFVWQQKHATGRTWEEACKYCEGLTLGAKTDWLLPTKREMASLPNYGVYDPAINTALFPDCSSWRYWTSSPSVRASFSDKMAWFVDFYDGDFGNLYMDGKYLVRCVRGQASGSIVDFVDNGNGTVTDKITGLVWQQGDGHNDEEGRTWEEALAFCETLSLGGHTDWRLPNMRELESLTDLSRFILPAIDPLFDCRSSYYWSSTTDAEDLDLAWMVSFSYGGLNETDKSSGSSSYYSYCVRCVRGGLNGSVPTVTTSAPTNIATTTATGGGDITSDGVSSVTAKGVCWSTAANPTTSASHTSDGTGPASFTSSITGLDPGTSYHVRAYATNTVGTGYGSDKVFTTTAIGPTAPTLTVTTSGTTVTISWTSVAGATGYTLYYAPFPYTGPDSIGNIPMGTQISMSASLWDGAAFYVAIQACDSNGCSGYSNIGYFVIDTSAPTRPTNLSATAVSSSQIDISWDASTDNVGVAGYNIYRDGNLLASSTDSFLAYEKSAGYEADDTRSELYKENGDGTILAYIERSPIVATATTDTNYSDTGLNANTQYCYSVSAYDSAGNESQLSSQKCSKTLEQSTCEGGGLPLVISDLNFPNTVASNSFVSGSVAYQGSFSDIVNPVMAYRVHTNTSTITSYLISAVPTTNNCRIVFTVPIPEVSGTGTSEFKLVDYVSGDSNWDDNGVSNVLSKTVTIN